MESPAAAELRAELLLAVGADPGDAEPVAADDSVATLSALRVAYRGPPAPPGRA